MAFPKVTFKVSEVRDCPKYRFGDTFTVSGNAVLMENAGSFSFINTTVIQCHQERENCKTLNGDLTKIIIEYGRAEHIPDCLISCTGCTGSIRLERSRSLQLEPEEPTEKMATDDVTSIIETVRNFPFFRNVDPESLKDITKFSTIQRFKKDNIIIRKGDQGTHFFVILSGSVDVLNETGIPITNLSRGEVFGETSLLCEEKIGATIQATEETEVLSINQKHFRKILDKYPVLQSYFTRLLAERLSKSNKMRTEDYASAMIGKLEEIPPEALFQTLNVNAKTGILTITQLRKGTARFSLRQGALIKASYGGETGEAAFYDILRENQGRFKFTPGLPPEDFDVPEIGYFMKLLMEGMQRIDEQPVPKAN